MGYVSKQRLNRSMFEHRIRSFWLGGGRTISEAKARKRCVAGTIGRRLSMGVSIN
jgi:hypothetical protein